MSPDDAAGPSRDAARAGVTQAGTPPHRITTSRAGTVATSHRARRDCPRPDLWATRPDPTVNYRHGLPFGLTLPELRHEWERQAAAGWARWELEARLAPAAEAVAA